MNNKELETRMSMNTAFDMKDEIADDLASALIEYMEAHMIETVYSQMEDIEFDTDEDLEEMHEAVMCKLLDMLTGETLKL